MKMVMEDIFSCFLERPRWFTHRERLILSVVTLWENEKIEDDVFWDVHENLLDAIYLRVDNALCPPIVHALRRSLI
jgi:hypothetical protein